MAKSQRRRGAVYPIISETLRLSLQAHDADEPETPEQALRKKLRQEILAELGGLLAVPKEAQPVAPPKAQFVRDPSLEKFFEMAAEEKAARRRHGH